MRELMIVASRKFAGITDGTTSVSNVSGDSVGVNGDGLKIGGTRVDLDLLCGANNKRCVTNEDGSLLLNEKWQIRFKPEGAEGKSEPPRVFRRLQPLREWSHEQVKQVFPRNARTGRANGA
jgi:filamentous hemagglutinin